MYNMYLCMINFNVCWLKNMFLFFTINIIHNKIVSSEVFVNN